MAEHRTQLRCQVCGKAFWGARDMFYCPACARQKKLDTVVRIRTCIDCGVEFYGGPRAKRCPDCAAEAQRKIIREYKRNGPKRGIGCVDKCRVCGKEYIVGSGKQKYCSEECAREGVLTRQREHKKGYDKASGQDAKKAARREQQEKVCIYCGRTFHTDRATNLCSDYCKSENRKLAMCVADIKRGKPRDLQRYLDAREKYREETK